MDSRQIIENKAVETKRNEIREQEKKEMLKYGDDENKFILSLVKALFFLILAICGNFLAETLSCQTQKMFKNMYAKHVILFFLIYFTINITTNTTEEPADPAVELRDAGILYIAFHLFTKMDFTFSFIIFMMLCAIYILGNYRELYNHRKEKLKKDPKMKELVWDYAKKTKEIQKYQTWLYYGSIGGILLGSFIYLLRKKKEYGSRFSLYTFFEGVEHCKGV